MPGFPIQDIRIQTHKSSEKQTWKQAWQMQFMLVQGFQTTFKIGPLRHQNQWKSKHGPQRMLSFAPQCPRIVPGFPWTPKWRHQARQMTRLCTKTLRSVCKNAKNPASRSHRASKYFSRGIRSQTPTQRKPDEPASHHTDQNLKSKAMRNCQGLYRGNSKC